MCVDVDDEAVGDHETRDGWMDGWLILTFSQVTEGFDRLSCWLADQTQCGLTPPTIPIGSAAGEEVRLMTNE